MSPDGIRTHSCDRRAASDQRLRPRGHWDRHIIQYRGAGKSLARPNSQCILFYGENIWFHTSLVIQDAAEKPDGF